MSLEAQRLIYIRNLYKLPVEEQDYSRDGDGWMTERNFAWSFPYP